MIKRQIAVTVVLSVCFMLVYGACNWLTTQRADVGMLFYEWERHIPVIPIFIIPYMSIDLFFVCAPFLLKRPGDLRVFAYRVLLGILIAGFFFLALPLVYAFPRPQVEGPLGIVFKFLHGFDQPHNLFPSLHIILRTLLAEVYVRYARGWWRKLCIVWFSLIGLSTIFTYQHHIPDIIAGFIVGILIIFAVPLHRLDRKMVPNRRIGYYYAALSIIFGIIGSIPDFGGIIWAWPTLCFLAITLGYWKFGTAVFRKSEGRIPMSTRIVLAPYLIGQWFYLHYYARRTEAWNEITPELWMGRTLSNREGRNAVERGVSAVIDLTCEFSENSAFRKLPYLNLQVLDLTAPALEDIQKAVGFISEHAHTGKVYVHCKLGYSRSAVIIAAYLLVSAKAQTAEEAIKLIRKSRTNVIIRPEAEAAIHGYFAAHAG